jgi:hypothetical protein
LSAVKVIKKHGFNRSNTVCRLDDSAARKYRVLGPYSSSKLREGWLLSLSSCEGEYCI